MRQSDLEARVAELEEELWQRDAKINELHADLADTSETLALMRRYIEDSNATMDQLTDLHGDSALWEDHAELLGQHHELIAEVKRLRRLAVLPDRSIGRPLAASEKQRADVLKRRKAGESLRAIAHATNLSVRSVRTVVEKDAGTDRTSNRAKELRRNEFTRQRAAAFRARKKAHDALPKQIEELQKTGAKLIKRAKGLGS